MAKDPKIAREIERLRQGAPSVFQVKPPPPKVKTKAPRKPRKKIAPPPEIVPTIPKARRSELRAAVAALPDDDLDVRRSWLLETFVELAAQRENLSIALKSAEWLARAYRLHESVTDSIEVQDRTAEDLAGGIDLETAQAIRAAAGKAA